MEMNKYSKEYFVKMGKKGGDKTKRIHGLKHFSDINPKKKRQEQEGKQENTE